MDPRPRVMGWLARGTETALLAGLGLLVLADLAIFANGLGQESTTPLVILSGLVTVVCVALRRRRLALAVVTASACSLALSLLASRTTVHPSVAEIAGLTVLTAAAARHRDARTAALLVTATGIALVGCGLRPDDPYLVEITTALFLAGVVAGSYLRWLDWQRDRAADHARRDERLDLARELHDLVAHYVTGIVVQAQAAQVVAEQQPAAARQALAAIERSGSDALAAMRRLVGSLRSHDTDEVAGPPAGSAGLRELMDHNNQLGVPARLSLHDVDPDQLPPAVAASVHRIVQESLTNVRRHGVEVTTVDVDLSRRGTAIEITVRDDGRSTTRPAAHSGFGLVGMAERVAALGGELQAGPLPGGGWQVQACLPVG